MVGMLENVPPLPWIVLFAPLVSALLITFFFLKSPKTAASVAVAGILVSFVSSAWLLWFHMNNHFLPAESGRAWLQVPGLYVEFGYLLDRLSLMMLMVVTGVGSCVFVYSTAYMHGDKSYGRFFASLSLFAFSMLGIVLANNFIMLFIFWELVAVSSYLLIGFWFEKPSAADAGNKAFIVNRLADFGMVLGMFSVWVISGLGGAANRPNSLSSSGFRTPWKARRP
jgi:NADH-quinone oxidoreductase subunit L